MNPQASQGRAFSSSGRQISSEKVSVLPGTYCVRGFLSHGNANIKLRGTAMLRWKKSHGTFLTNGEKRRLERSEK